MEFFGEIRSEEEEEQKNETAKAASRTDQLHRGRRRSGDSYTSHEKLKKKSRMRTEREF